MSRNVEHTYRYVGVSNVIRGLRAVPGGTAYPEVIPKKCGFVRIGDNPLRTWKLITKCLELRSGQLATTGFSSY